MEQLDYLEIDDIEVFEVLNNPFRFRVLRQLMEPRTVREIAETLEIPPTRLYYHVNLLEEVGVIAVVETRKAGAMVQKVYQAKARGLRPSARMARGNHEPSELARITTGLALDGARVDAEEALTGHFQRMRESDEGKVLHGALGRTVALFSREEAEEFADKLRAFIEEEFDPDDRDEGEEYGLTFMFFPVAGAQVETEE